MMDDRDLNVIFGGDTVYIQVWGSDAWLKFDKESQRATITLDPRQATKIRLTSPRGKRPLILGNAVNLSPNSDGYLDMDYFRGLQGDFLLGNRILRGQDPTHSMWAFSVPFDETRQMEYYTLVRYGERVQMLHVVSDLWVKVDVPKDEITATKLLSQASFFCLMPAEEMWTCADKDARLCLETSGSANLDLGLYRGTRITKPYITGLFTRAGHRVFVKDEKMCQRDCRNPGWKCSGAPNFKCVQSIDADDSFDDCFMSCWPERRV